MAIRNYNDLPEKLKDVDKAIRELLEVLTGGAFDPTKMWGDQAWESAEIYEQMKNLPIDPGLQQKVADLLKDLPVGGPIRTAIQAVTKGLTDVVNGFQTTTNDLAGDRLNAFKALNSPHAEGVYAQAPYGLFPAIFGVINAAADTNFDTESVTGPIEDVANVAAAANLIQDFIKYANGAIYLLGLALPAS